MELSIAGRSLYFSPVDLVITQRGVTNVFAAMNSQTVAGMVAKPRYAHLTQDVAARYAEYLGLGVGQFLGRLKQAGNPFYRRFLNRYGDQVYCQFAIRDHLNSRGIYAYTQSSKLVYIGRSRDPFAKRINYGYGRIAPRNCYLDGQATNCHLNALIAEAPETVSFHVFPMDDSSEIVQLERLLILQEKPRWNIALSQEGLVTS